MEPIPPIATDEELAAQALAGSPAAFEELVYRYEHRVHAFVFSACHHRADAAEITQDTFVKAFQCLGQFDPRRKFAAWLFTIARRQCIDRHRAAARRLVEPEPEKIEEADPAELTARQEDRHALWQLARRQLGSSQYQALWLHYVEDLEVAQIAQVMGKTRVHVKVLLFRARQILARHVRPGQPVTAAVPGVNSAAGAPPPARPPNQLTTFAHHENLVPKI